MGISCIALLLPAGRLVARLQRPMCASHNIVGCAACALARRSRTRFVKWSRCFFDCAVKVSALCSGESAAVQERTAIHTYLGEQHGEEGKGEEGCEEGFEKEGRREEAQVGPSASAR